MRLKDKVTLVTGGARGIGAATARLFAQEGANIAVADIIKEEGEGVAREIRAQGGTAVFMSLDVTDEKNWDEAIRAVLSEFGKLDVVVNSAGVSVRGPLVDLSLEEWERLMSVNSTGVFLGTRAAARVMMEGGGGGSIINLSSIFGLVGSPHGPAYAASKGAVKLLSKTAAIQLAPHKIRVNSICPGFCRTPLTAALWEDRETLERLTKAHPLGRLGRAEDVAYGALYLASDESSFVTGSELVIDGGYTCQ